MALSRMAGNWPLPADADRSASRVSRVCGTRITVGLVLTNDGRISGYGHSLAHACALSRAAASIVGRGAIGRDRIAVATALEALDRVLARGAGEGTLAPVWPDLEMLGPVADIPTRHESVRLPFQAVLEALSTSA